PWPGAALGGQPGEDTAPTAAEEDRAEEVVAVSRSDEHAGRAGVRRAMSKSCPCHDSPFLVIFVSVRCSSDSPERECRVSDGVETLQETALRLGRGWSWRLCIWWTGQQADDEHEHH